MRDVAISNHLSNVLPRTLYLLCCAWFFWSSPISATTLVSGSKIDGVFSTQGQIEVFTFDAEADQRVFISGVDTAVSGSSNIAPFITLLKFDGALLASDSDPSVARINSYRIPETGTYTLQLQHSTTYGGGGVGPYSVYFTQSGVASELGVIDEVGNSEYLDKGDIDSYHFYGNVGAEVHISVSDTQLGGSDDIAPLLYLYDPDGVYIAADSDPGVAELHSRLLTVNGIYKVVVLHSETYSGLSGSYDIHFANSGDDSEEGVLQPGITNSVLTLGDIDSYKFNASQGDNVTISMSDTGNGSTENIAPSIYVYNPDGSLRASDSDPGLAQLSNLALSQTGQYTLVAFHSRTYSGSVGPYAISYNCVGSCADQTPQPPTLQSPTGSLTDNTPTYRWSKVNNATWYQLWVNDGSGTLINKWYTAMSAGCRGSSDFCLVTPPNSVTGNATWWVRAWNPKGNSVWSNPLSFSIQTVVPPGSATLIAPSGTATSTPTYSWQAVSDSTWYYLWVQDGTQTIKTWYTAEQAGCQSGNGVCAVTPSTAMNGNVIWWVQTWNSQGLGPWSSALTFTVSSQPPKATLLSPSGTIFGNTPIYQWNAVANSTWYYLWVSDSTGTPIKKWYTANQANCGLGVGTCSVQPSVSVTGSATWWIQTWNSDGTGPWSDPMSFTAP